MVTVSSPLPTLLRGVAIPRLIDLLSCVPWLAGPECTLDQEQPVGAAQGQEMLSKIDATMSSGQSEGSEEKNRRKESVDSERRNQRHHRKVETE